MTWPHAAEGWVETLFTFEHLTELPFSWRGNTAEVPTRHPPLVLLTVIGNFGTLCLC
jgi:hypothetical protein